MQLCFVCTCSGPRSTCPDLIGKIPALSERVESDPRPLVSPLFTPPIFLLTDHRPMTCPDQRSRSCGDPVGVTAHYCRNSFRCNTYKKHEVGVPVMVNQISDEEICPEEHGDEGPLFASDKGSWLERQALSASPGPAGTVNLLRAVPLNSRLLPLIGRSLRTGPGRLSKASFQLSAFDCEPLPWRSSQHSHICYSGGPTMITSAPLLPQNARRKRKPTP